MPASLWICIEIDPHSHSACTKLTEIFPPALQNYLENAVVMFWTTPCELCRNIFNTEHVFNCKECAHCKNFYR